MFDNFRGAFFLLCWYSYGIVEKFYIKILTAYCYERIFLVKNGYVVVVVVAAATAVDVVVVFVVVAAVINFGDIGTVSVVSKKKK